MENGKQNAVNEKLCVCTVVDGEKREFNLEEAAALCKEALELGSAKENYGRLVEFAKADDISVPEFLNTLENARTQNRLRELAEKCGGNEELAKHILKLEMGSTKESSDVAEFEKYFPNLDISLLPESVKRSAKQNNRSLLDEYLRYRALAELNAEKEAIKRKENELSSTGSLKNVRDLSFESAEFLKGLWR